jgi:hypothetical protein
MKRLELLEKPYLEGCGLPVHLRNIIMSICLTAGAVSAIFLANENHGRSAVTVLISSIGFALTALYWI